MITNHRGWIKLVKRGEAGLEGSDLHSLAILNGMVGYQFLDFVGTLAWRNPANPVAGWIDSKPWDGTDCLSPKT